MITIRSFTTDLALSLAAEPRHKAILARVFNTQEKLVVKTTSLTDMAGIDYYVATRETVLSVDVKSRYSGAQYWAMPGVPEMAIELYGPLTAIAPLPDYYVYTWSELPNTVAIVQTVSLRKAVVAGAFSAGGYRVFTTRTSNEFGGFSTPCIYVPYPAVASAVRRAGGMVWLADV